MNGFMLYLVKSDNLMDFIDMVGINDLHEANYGLTKDGRVVIFDFSGYCD